MGDNQKVTSVLIVEDEFIIASNIQRDLQRLGYAVAGVCDSSDGLDELILGESPDIVLMDIGINGKVDGIAAAAYVQERFSIPVVYLSGLREEDIMDRIPETRPFGFVAKPFTSHELQVAISIALYKSEAENRIRQQEIQIQQLLDNMDQGFCLLDQKGRLRYANRKILNTLGTGLDKLRKIHLRELVENSDFFFSLFNVDDTIKSIPPGFRMDPFTATIHFKRRKFDCYIVPQFFSDKNTGKIQGCFLSILNIAALEAKIALHYGK